MKDILLLTKILYKNSFIKNKNEANKIRSIFIFLAIIAYIFIALGIFSKEIITALIEINQEKLFITFSLVLICGVTLFRTILTSINILFFSKDIEFLLPMPLKSIKIVFAKFNIMLISNILSELIVFSVPYIIYWYLLKLKISFLFYSLLIFLILPIIPMILSSIIIIVFMRFTKFIRNKDIVQYISVIFSFIMIIIVQKLNLSKNGITNAELLNKINEINGLSDFFSKYFFAVKLSNNILFSTNNFEAFKKIVELYSSSICIYVLSIFLISKSYLKIALNVNNSTLKTSKLKIKNLNKSNALITYVLKEFKLLIRTPIFLFQCVLPSFILPIFFCFPLLDELRKSTITGMSLLEYTDLFSDFFSTPFGFGILLIGVNFLFMFNYMSVTSLSREREDILFIKYIPILLKNQFKYKAIPGIIVNFFPMIFIFSLLKIACPSINNIVYIEAIIISILCNILVNYFAVLIDALNPKLHWSSEYMVVKQNINMLYSSMINIIFIGIIFIISYCLKNLNIVVSFLFGILILTLLIFNYILNKYQEKIFRKIS